MTTHIADLKTFLGKINATIVVKSFGDQSNLNKSLDVNSAYIKKVEIMAYKTLLKRTIYSYDVELRTTSDVLLETMLEALIDNIYKVLVGTAIAGYSRPAQLCSLSLYHVGEIYREKTKKGTWHYDTKLIMEWAQ